MSLEFFHVERLEKHIQRLKELRYRNRIYLNDFLATPDVGEQVNPSPLKPTHETYELKLNDIWSGRDKYIWLTKDIQIPSDWNNEKIVGVFDLGTTGGCNNSGFESLLYVNGSLYQGVDSNHKEVFFDVKKLGNTIKMDFRLWSGLEGGGMPQIQYHQIKEAYIACLDSPTDDLYYTGLMVAKTIKVLDEGNYYKHNLEKILIKTMQMVNFTNQSSQAFYDSVKVAKDFLNRELDKFQKDSNIHVFCVGHTHIDVAWLWRLKHTREKVARSFSIVNRLMEKYDDYIFLQTQAQLYDYVKDDFPEIYKMIKERVKQGKWEPSGSMWVEADCNLISGESLVRQILYGKRFFQKEFGYKNSFLWLPDTFGYSWAMPQILKKSNIDTFITTKISWNEYNKIPSDTFIWRGIDGTEILTHFITTPEIDAPSNWFSTYNGILSPETVKGVWDNYGNKDLNSDLLISYGYGDGGGGANRDMLENRRQLDKIPGLPKVSNTNVTNYLERLHANIKDKENNGYLHTWDNELYLECHRGTYTSQAYNKKMNRLLEFRYREAEILQVISSLANRNWDNYYASDFEKGWKIILRNQFHDIITGTSIKEVYEDSKEEYNIALNIVNKIIDKSFKSIVKDQANSFTVFNSGSFNRSGLVTIALSTSEEVHFEDEQGNVLPAQIEKDSAKIYIKNILPLSFQNIYIKEKAIEQESQFKFEKNSVESNKYIVEWNEEGHLVNLYDKELKRNALKGNGNVFEVFEDKPRKLDAWEIEPTIDLKKEIIKVFKGAKLVSNGCHYVKILFEWKYNKTTISQYMVLYHYSNRIDFETTVNWQEREKLLKVAFPVDIRSTKARYDIQFGNVERPTHRSTSWDFAKFEVVGHKWADLSEKGFGVALLNNCKYGYDIQNNNMRLSLLKSACYPDPEADRGIHKFTYSIFIHGQEWYDSNLAQEAWDLNVPMPVIKGCVEEPVKNLFEMDDTNIVIDAVKKTEDGNHIIIRMHEQYCGKSDVALKLNFDFISWCEADLMENKIGHASKENIIKLTLRPYELCTILIQL